MSRIIELKFTGLHKIMDYYDIDLSSEKVNIKKSLPDNGVRLKRPGFYVWGFCVDNNFIPYYVGESQGCILSRIKLHISDIIKHDSSYVRISNDYFAGENGCEPFYKDKLFFPNDEWIYSDRLPSWVINNKNYFINKILYCNNKKFFELFYAMKDLDKDRYGRGYPISNLKLNRMKDDMLLSNIDRMHFICAEYDLPEIGDDRRKLYETLESYVKYSLKGKTVCDVLLFSTMQDNINKQELEVRINSVEKIRHLFKDRADHSFYPGYDF